MLGNTEWTIECDALTAATPRVDRARVRESLDRPYEVEVSLTTRVVELDVAPLLGKDAVVILDRAPLQRRFCGIITDVEIDETSSRDVGTDFTIHIRPALFALGLGSDSRIYQAMTVPEIVADVLTRGLAPYSRTFEQNLTETYPKREYCVQYRESDLAFVERLLAEEGISLAFDHSGETETIVLRDANVSFPHLVTVGGDTVRFNPNNTAEQPTERVVDFQLARELMRTKLSLLDADFTRNDLLVKDEEGGAGESGRIRESYEHGLGQSLTLHDYDAGVRRYRADDASRQKRIRLELHQRDEVHVFSAGSDVSGLAPGVVFKLVEHPSLGVDGEYLITHVMHSDMCLPGSSHRYSNRFQCIPIAATYRPSRDREKPSIRSIQTAVVTGPGGEDIHVDEHGRIKVQFHWDRLGNKDERTSCWIRTQQTWAGNGFGTWWVPRIGMEVIVQFVDGDPDRPLVTGCVYNADHALPYDMPAEKTKSTIKSQSSLGGGGFNEFRFEDKAGSEEIFLHAQKDLNEKVLHDHTLDVGNNETITIGVDQQQTIGSNQTEKVGSNATLEVGANRSVKVSGNFEEKVSGTETRTVTGATTVTLNGGETRTVNASSTINVNGGQTLNISGGVCASITGGEVREIAGGIVETVVGTMRVETSAEIDMKAAAVIKQLAPQIQRLEAQMKDISADKSWITNTSMSVTLFKAALNITEIATFGVKGTLGGVNLAAYGLNRSVEALKTDNSAITTTGSGLEVNMDGCRIIT